MFRYSKHEMAQLAEELNFVRDTLEKVYRLAEILSYINSNPIMKDSLALKGGTAINLTVFDLPRLSVDIDLDYNLSVSREKMLQNRKAISDDLELFISSQGYIVGPQTRKRHSLDSFVLIYQNLGGTKDNIKIEINYSLRSHVFFPELRNIKLVQNSPLLPVLTLNPIELFAAKINALLSRAAARDLYDTFNMIKANLFKPDQLQLLRKCVAFYTAISQDTIPELYDYSRVENISFRKIQTDLLPVIHRGTYIDINEMKDTVIYFLSTLLELSNDEKEFLTAFKNKSYKPELLFKETTILSNIAKHPMVVWKMMNHDNI